MRDPKLTSIVWYPVSWIRKERFRNLLSKDSLKDVFDDKFFEGVAKRLSDLESRALKVLGIETAIFAVLAMSLIPINVRFTLFGISPVDTKGLREVLLIASGCLTLFGSTVNQEMRYLKEMLKVRAEKAAGQNEDAKRFLLLPFGLSDFSDPEPTEDVLSSGWHKKLLNAVRGLLTLVLLLLLTSVYFGIQILIMADIIERPSISDNLSILVTSFVVLTHVVIFAAWYMSNGLLPYKNAKWEAYFAAMKKSGPDLYERLMRVTAQEHKLKWWPISLFGRPTPVKTWRRIERIGQRRLRRQAKEQAKIEDGNIS